MEISAVDQGGPIALVGAALNDVRNEAGKRGADYVYVGKPQLGIYYGSTRSASFGGRAYRCAARSNDERLDVSASAAR